MQPLRTPPYPTVDDRYHVETPEQLALGFEVAGLGSRGLAAIIDLIVLLISIVLLWLLGWAGIRLAAAPIRHVLGVSREAAELMVAGVVVLLNFVLFWGYYVFFDLIWRGQSPGKRWLGLRVIKAGGYPVDFTSSVVRNIVRLADFLPVYYGLGAVVMSIDRYSRRLGDLAAGTLVVKERKDLKLDSLATPYRSAPPIPPSAAVAVDLAARLSPSDRALLREYWSRRVDLQPEARARLASQLAAAFAIKLGIETPPAAEQDDFLVSLAHRPATERASDPSDKSWGDAG